jgi:hypothetical protein
MSSLSDQIRALADGLDATVPLAEVLKLTDRAVLVEIDPELHPEAPSDLVRRLNWEPLDTAWKLLREYAVRITLAEVRAQAKAQGIDFPEDEELFRLNAEGGDPFAATEYLDLAPASPQAARFLAQAFNELQNIAFQEAAEGMNFAVVDSAADLPAGMAEALRAAGLLD